MECIAKGRIESKKQKFESQEWEKFKLFASLFGLMPTVERFEIFKNRGGKSE